MISPVGLSAAAAVVMALGLQIQPTVSLAGTPLRVSAADIVAALCVPLAAWLWWRYREGMRRDSLILWLVPAAAATIVMTYGLAIGAAGSGGVQPWALIKYAGWFVLLAYAALGAILATANPGKAIRAFTWTTVLTHAVLLAVYLVFASAGMDWPGTSTPRMSGLIANPNAYGFALLCGLALFLAGKDLPGLRIGRLGLEALAGLLCAGVLFSRSVGALIGLGVMIAVFLVLRGNVVPLARIALFAGLIYVAPAGILATLSQWNIASPQHTSSFSKPRRLGIEDKLRHPEQFGGGLVGRTGPAQRAIAAWRKAPLFGTGLGTFLLREQQLAKTDGAALQVHNTALWLLSEFGIVGLAVFAGCYFGFLLFLYRARGRLAERDPPLAAAVVAGLLIMVAWGADSLVHELMYQRLPWFILGMCAAAALTPPAHGAPE